MLEKTRSFLSEVKSELKKVAWPTRDEVVGSTVVVIVSMFMFAFALGVIDYILMKVIQLVIR